MQNIEWNDGQGSRDRRSWAVLIAQDGTLTPFTGQSLAKLVAVVGQSYKKGGKWSATTYTLTLPDGVRFVSGLMGWETGTLAEGIGKATQASANSWADLALALGATPASVEAWVRASAPRTAQILDDRAAALAALD